MHLLLRGAAKRDPVLAGDVATLTSEFSEWERRETKKKSSFKRERPFHAPHGNGAGGSVAAAAPEQGLPPPPRPAGGAGGAPHLDSAPLGRNLFYLNYKLKAAAGRGGGGGKRRSLTLHVSYHLLW